MSPSASQAFSALPQVFLVSAPQGLGRNATPRLGAHQKVLLCLQVHLLCTLFLEQTVVAEGPVKAWLFSFIESSRKRSSKRGEREAPQLIPVLAKRSGHCNRELPQAWNLPPWKAHPFLGRPQLSKYTTFQGQELDSSHKRPVTLVDLRRPCLHSSAVGFF